MASSDRTPVAAAPWHDGERAVQERLGETHLADRTIRGMGREVPPVAAEFLAQQSFVVVSARTDDDRVWTSVLTGEPGFARAPQPDVLRIAAHLPAGDPLAGPLAQPHLVGVLAIEPATRRRSRFNGRARPTADGIEIDLDQVFSNCPKYIQRREISSRRAGAGAPRPDAVHRGWSLTTHQQEWLRHADTFFFGTIDAVGNADSSHRGGNPGFVEVVGEGRFRFPDYVGNHMYMTLGNLEVEPAAGYLFVDWATGSTLQIAGLATVDYGPEARTIDVSVLEVVEMPGRVPLEWTEPEMSRFNP